MLKNVIGFISNMIEGIFDLPNAMKSGILRLKLFVKDQILKFENLTETNLELGKYHLHNGNINDAMIRFRIAGWLLRKDNPEIHYWLGSGAEDVFSR